jgi:hypothetical protein
MSRDTWRPWLVAVVLAGGLAGIYLFQSVRQTFRPELLEVRVVTATPDDQVYRGGVRHLTAGEHFTAAVALKVRRKGSEPYWMAPVEKLSLDGAPTPHKVLPAWPERDRSARVLWMTLESANLGGELVPGKEKELLRYRTFLAGEMGRTLIATNEPEPHNDDFLAPEDQPRAGGPGTFRLAARVEIVADPSHITPQQAVMSPGPGNPTDPRVAVVMREWDVPEEVRPEAGELFGLPGFEPPPGDPAGVRSTLVELADRRLAVSSAAFASTALTGRPGLDPATLPVLETVRLTGGRLLGASGALRWGTSVRPGDLLEASGHWLVLLADDGDGTLDLDDQAAHCWGHPPARGALSDLIEPGPMAFRLRRHGN